MIKPEILDILQNSFGLLAGVKAPEGHHLLEANHHLDQGCTKEKNFIIYMEII